MLGRRAAFKKIRQIVNHYHPYNACYNDKNKDHNRMKFVPTFDTEYAEYDHCDALVRKITAACRRAGIDVSCAVERHQWRMRRHLVVRIKHTALDPQ